MRVLAVKALHTFWDAHPDVEERLKAWVHDAERSTWRTPMDIKRVYANASFLTDNRVVFNIKGNSYRLVLAINYEAGVVRVRFIGTHQNYDRIDAETI